MSITRNWRWYDWFVTGAAWVSLSVLLGVLVAEGTGSEEVGVGTWLITMLSGPVVLYVRRLIRLARGEEPIGLTTGQMVAERIAELEARVAELESSQARVWDLEERLDFAERLFARSGAPAAGLPQPVPLDGTPERRDEGLAAGD